ncbi:DUF6249 domain-containing protein [Gammaproteobacteria bacterium]|jgi:hypothetical protein|nr:DUF6249 domain-containing protein [Gammaproteobacteria bacterium]MDA7734600.1 DUF6249 domain-containing protein [Gammaproteobacteria bacterium]MDA8864911.1 DUF6249 domain-containing protein [Gammaproteobacteria bacterium]MDA8908013.1 DUF6249 domain-containing protein [Gammaproteobacteria bacterium]MDA9113414.1 DUF6249 domain-containing protein [Gammaproteobacteria bacterium]|tara:strand:+ start:81 stop:488 length:408 start_codon:yes stop_codon:yes gene_type:complete
MDEVTGLVAVGTGWVAILMPVFITWVILYYSAKMDKDKYVAMVEISKNLEDPSDIEDLLENFKEKKKPTDYRRNGVTIFFVGLGLFLFGTVSDIDILKGVGVLISTIGIGSFVAGYIYPNAGSEIDKAVEKFEER